MFLPSPEKIVPTQEDHRITFTPLNTKMFKAKKMSPYFEAHQNLRSIASQDLAVLCCLRPCGELRET